MGLVCAVRSEFTKTKHTPFLAIHVVVPLLGACLFLGYYVLYQNVADHAKFKLIVEITNTIFPLLISGIVGLNVALEEKASHFQSLLAVHNRNQLLLAKMLVLYGAGVAALFFMFALFGLGTYAMGLTGGIPFIVFLQAIIGMAFCNLILYLFHLFLSLKFGLGVSLFWGVFECLQSILYSNIELQGIWRYIPFAWSMNWLHDTLNHRLPLYATQWTVIFISTICVLLLTLKWFSQWEGRKNCE